MNETKKAGVAAFYDSVADQYGDQYRKDQFDELAVYPANYFRLQILVQRLSELRPRNLYEVGTGEGSPLAVVASMGIDVAGCDISEEMVKATRKRLEALDIPVDRCKCADIEDPVSFASQLAAGPFDAAIAFGVLPHVANDASFLANMRGLIKPDGRVFVEFRNKLFSLFTMNRYTREFILDDLLHDVAPEVKDAVGAELGKRLATEFPPVRSKGKDGAPGYDAIPARFHNPFELQELMARSGFRDMRLYWYHYHPAMPYLEGAIGKAFRKEAMKLEHDPSDWRGFFLCSAGIVEAVRA